MTEDTEATVSQWLDELDPPAWGAASSDDSYLVRRCHELRPGCWVAADYWNAVPSFRFGSHPAWVA